MLKNKKLLNMADRLLNIPYRILFLFAHKSVKRSQQKKKYYFSVCSIFKDEAKYLHEWIEYNRIVGIDHLYLYNNNSTDDFHRILAPYINEGYITLVEWPKQHAQMEAYEHCYENHKQDTNWLAFFDIDEFICPLRETDIKDFLRKYEGYPAVMVYWLLFGTNGQLKPEPSKLVTEQFTCSWDQMNGTGKMILSTNQRYAPTHIYHHHMYCRFNILGLTIIVPMINEHRKFIFFPQLYKTPSQNTIQLNHYFSKSYEEYVFKINKGDVASQYNEEIRNKIDFFYNHECGNKTENKAIFRFMIKLKLALLQ